jgi:crotonobetainyl-CoA:carnitine CoA-transferase CaiB-like acyl-CoA transferase
VLTWGDLIQHEGFLALNMLQEVGRAGMTPFRTTRCPVRIDGKALVSARPAPRLGEHTPAILRELAASSTGCS